MKRPLVLFIFVIASFSLFSQKQLRDYVVIVRPVYHESTLGFLKSFSDKLDSKGYSESASYLKEYSEGKGFGSGFLVRGSDNNVYILTNSHVVMQAEKVNIEFSNTDGGVVNYKDCKIIEIDEDIDMALLKFPDDVKIDRSLSFCMQTVDDGSDVVSVGFPGLGGKPSWQLGKGIVSNSAFSMSTIDDEMNLNVIQHTAQIDRGSSGSPLLMADTAQSIGFSVIGMNTWKVRDRESVNLSIPSKLIVKFIENALNKDKLNNNQILENHSREFVSDAMSGYKKVLKYVSYDYISKLSVENFFRLVDKATKDAKEDIYDAFKYQHPIEAVRIAIADAIAQSVVKNKDSFQFQSIVGMASAENTTSVIFQAKGKNITSGWVIEQNKWKMNEIASLKMVGEDQRVGFVSDFDWSHSISFDMSLPNAVESAGYGFSYSQGERLYRGFGLHKYAHKAYKNVYDENDVRSEVEGFQPYYNIGILHIGYRLPFQVKKFYLVPFAQLNAGFNTSMFTYYSINIKYGMQVWYKLKDSKYVSLHCSLASRSVNTEFGSLSLIGEPEYDFIKDSDVKFTTFNIGVGYSF